MPKQNNNVPNVFNKVYHIPREILGISIEEYCLVDTVCKMSQQQYKDHPSGWCYASKGYFARILGLNRVSVQRMIKRLITQELLIKGKSTGNRVVPLRTGPHWHLEQVFNSENTKDSFTNIYHMARSKLGLSCGEYCILDALAWLEEYKAFIWHRGTKRWLADRMSMPYSTFSNLFQRILRRGFLYPEEERGGFNYGGNCIAYKVVDDFRYIISEDNRKGIMSLENAIDSVGSNAHSNANWKDSLSPEELVEIEG